MADSGPWLGLVLGASLLLPSPGTTSREREFCGTWLKLTTPERQEVLRAAEVREADAGWDGKCRAGLRSGLRHALDSECRNWKALMGFEVRAVVDRVLEPCRRPAR